MSLEKIFNLPFGTQYQIHSLDRQYHDNKRNPVPIQKVNQTVHILFYNGKQMWHIPINVLISV